MGFSSGPGSYQQTGLVYFRLLLMVCTSLWQKLEVQELHAGHVTLSKWVEFLDECGP